MSQNDKLFAIMGIELLKMISLLSKLYFEVYI